MQGIYLLFVLLLVLLGACGGKGDHPGYEFAPQMYHSVPYEPLSQIEDIRAGRWLSSQDGPVSEFYNANPYNGPSAQTMRLPVPGTVPRTEDGTLPYRLPAEALEEAARTLKNPLDATQAVLNEGETLYKRFCMHCHGATGQGDGPVGKVYKGIPAYNARALKTLSEGHIFHVITHGKSRMSSHSSQISPKQRWKIVRYVQTLQQQQP